MCGGGGSGTSKDQLKRQNDLIDQQLQQQTALRNQIMGGVGKYLNGAGEGFDPQQLAIMQSQFLDQNAAAGKQAGQNVMSSLAARGLAGGNLPASGSLARDLADLQGTIATSQSQGILGTNLANLQQALTNRFNAANIASGQTAQLGGNIGTFQGGANNALSNYVQAQQSTFGNRFASGFGSALGQGLGNIGTFGIGSSLGNLGKYLSQQKPISVDTGGASVIPQYSTVPVPTPNYNF